MKFPKPQTRSLRAMRRFDALELHACVELKDEHGEKFIEQADEELQPTMFSVYGHVKTGGIFCLEDFDTHKVALAWKHRPTGAELRRRAPVPAAPAKESFAGKPPRLTRVKRRSQQVN